MHCKKWSVSCRHTQSVSHIRSVPDMPKNVAIYTTLIDYCGQLFSKLTVHVDFLLGTLFHIVCILQYFWCVRHTTVFCKIFMLNQNTLYSSYIIVISILSIYNVLYSYILNTCCATISDTKPSHPSFQSTAS